MMRRIQNMMRGEGQRAAAAKAPARRGTISAYDPNNYAAKVIIQPEGFETGFLPIASPYVGNGFGLFFGPGIGDEVDVHFQEGGRNAAYISLRFFGNRARPLSVPSGEVWLVTSSGSKAKFTNDGKVTLSDPIGSTLTLNADGTATLVANLTIVGNLIVSEDISDWNGDNGSVQNLRDTYDIHTHGGVQGGAADTAVPNQTL
jgi:uncharacterized protein involved in type VI secretion and phage assembly